MYNMIKNEIKTGRKLTEVIRLLDIAMTSGKLTAEQYAELNKEAIASANKDDNQPDLREMVIALAARVEALEKNAGLTSEPDGGEYETWKPWDGISNKYQQGAIVYHAGTGKLWESIFAGQNTWEPGTVGTELLWREYSPDA